MSWGMPPKYKVVHRFENVPFELINQSVVEALNRSSFEMTNNTGFVVGAIKKFGFTFMSFFAWARPKINLTILITKGGRITISSTYNYNSMFGVAINDLGRQEKQITVLLEEVQYLVINNREEDNYNVISFDKSTTNLKIDREWTEDRLL